MNEREILDVGQRWADAERRGDPTALDALLDDNFEAVGPHGFVLNRQQWLDRYQSGDLKNEAFAWQDANLRTYGDAAITVGVQTQRTVYQGHDSSGRFRVTHLYVRKDGRWLIANIQLSGPIQDMPTR